MCGERGWLHIRFCILLPLKSRVNPSKWFLLQKSWTVHCWFCNPLSKGIKFGQNFFTMTNLTGNWRLPFFYFSHYRPLKESVNQK